MIQREVQKLFTKEMNRREFLAHVGAGVLAMIGVSGMIKHLVQLNSAPRSSRTSLGYGSSPYGGHKK